MKQIILNSWQENDNSKANYDVANEITYNTEVLKSSLWDYKDGYILVKATITIKGCWT